MKYVLQCIKNFFIHHLSFKPPTLTIYVDEISKYLVEGALDPDVGTPNTGRSEDINVQYVRFVLDIDHGELCANGPNGPLSVLGTFYRKVTLSSRVIGKDETFIPSPGPNEKAVFVWCLDERYGPALCFSLYKFRARDAVEGGLIVGTDGQEVVRGV